MKDTILTILMIGAIFIVLPLLIVRAKDRGGILGLLVKRIFGALSFVFGLIIIGWVVYNLFCPTEEFKASVSTSLGPNKATAVVLMVARLSVPLAMVGMGWHWLMSKKNESGKDTENNGVQAIGDKSPQPDP